MLPIAQTTLCQMPQRRNARQAKRLWPTRQSRQDGASNNAPAIAPIQATAQVVRARADALPTKQCGYRDAAWV